MYDQREKGQRDYDWALSGAREEGERLGLEKGERLGLERGERLGFDKGVLVGKIHLLEEMLGEVETGIDELRACERDILALRLAELRQRLRNRPA